MVGDSREYEQIRLACNEIKNVEGLVLEIGTRLGAGIFNAMEACAANDDAKNRVFIGVDPYGGIAYKHGERSAAACKGEQIQSSTGFDLGMMNTFLANIYLYCEDQNLHYNHYTLEDSEFMRIYKDGVTIYTDCKKIINEYALIIVDGPHDIESVKSETIFFKDRLNSGGVLVYDDVTDYDHQLIDDILIKEDNFVRLVSGSRKITYKKQ